MIISRLCCHSFSSIVSIKFLLPVYNNWFIFVYLFLFCLVTILNSLVGKVFSFVFALLEIYLDFVDI